MKKEYSKPELTLIECELESAYLLFYVVAGSGTAIPYGGEDEDITDEDIYAG